MFVFQLVLSSSHVFTCSHEIFQKQTLRELTEPLERKTMEVSTDEGLNESIRIKFDMSSIDHASLDPSQCTSVTGTCTSNDILTDAKRTTIKETFYTVKEFLESNINITRNPNDEYDLTISVYAQPFGSSSSGLAYASSLAYNGVNGRPSQGKIVVNPAKLPDKPETFQSGDRQFIMTVLHELNHVLSFSSSLFNKWITNVTALHYTDAYGKEINESAYNSYTGYLIPHKYLQTPHLLAFVNDRFHVSSPQYMHLGLEIEDGGGSGTAGSHPNERLFFTDLMQGRTYGPGWISGIFYNTLWDTGWYAPSTNVTEELIYLNDYINTKIEVTEKVLLQPPTKSFPATYLCQSTALQACFYDYTFTGACSLKSTSEVDFEGHEGWYNPENKSEVGQDDLLDYAPLLLPWYSCRTNGSSGLQTMIDYDSTYDYTKHGETFNANSTCALSTLNKGITGNLIATPRCYEAWCGSDNKVRLVVDDEEYYCKYDGQSASFSNYAGTVTCPPAAQVCANRNLTEVFGVSQLFPDRGPIDGQNLVGIMGSGYSKYNASDVTITIGTVPCQIKIYKDNYILCKLDTPSTDQQTLIKKGTWNLLSSSTTTNVYRQFIANVTTFGVFKLPDMYVFTKKKYAD
ncbi:GP63-like [Trichomonas vaginalis G3]|uniref:GP63-like n=1 Tax=Trichomonas vaginalis (strain ATCC PRA-98 / G3) TaxID=412133 RepID=A2DFM3_TRIV3|nr:regulation of choline O-acetyltransferase protein [Trichomonas vaginalis G3]EAY20726.1 GP63-like [Trichomonas vaginalis G3]KAI5529499.1 regulation of choline O-acetyltransferase protein [Trichomonas vaginalis G3]|eukprot:XP_001581712.1 GP63-like [Trichomonas vaginalis G3]